MMLAELKTGQTATITKVGGEGPLRLRFLDMGLIPRTDVTHVKTAPMGDPIEIRIRGYELTLRLEEARNIEITDVRDVWKVDSSI
ncbi:MAG: ferrous iron transport protein A [Clostridiales bacterium]|jgi:Fe2+ transport system protein FeoA|nr:ferrous iron transport protein A [Clostridiales bacterium]